MRQVIGWVLAGTLVSFAAAAAEEANEQRNAVSAAQRAVLDPVTRRPMKPTPQQRGRSAFGRQRRDYSQMITENRPDGEQIVHVMGQLQAASLARLNADGSVELECVHGDVHAGHDHPHPASPRTSEAPE